MANNKAKEVAENKPAIIGHVKARINDIREMSASEIESLVELDKDYAKTHTVELEKLDGELVRLRISEKQAERLQEEVGKCFIFAMERTIAGKTTYVNDEGAIIPHEGSADRIELFENRKGFSERMFDKLQEKLLEQLAIKELKAFA